MNKTEAAEFLDISARTLERYTAQHRLHPTLQKGKTRPVLDYDPEELEQLKNELQAALEPSFEISTDASSPNLDNQSNSLATLARKPARLVKHDNRQIATTTTNELGDISIELMHVLATVAQSGAQPVQEIAAKLLLKLDEATLLTGLSRATLRAAIAEGTLKASLIGRTWRIKRVDLDRYIEAL